MRSRIPLRKASGALARSEGTHVVGPWSQCWSKLRESTAVPKLSLVEALNQLAMRPLVTGVVRTDPVCRFS